MGRGLSDLQKWILIAASNAPEHSSGLAILYYQDICMQYFGWLPGWMGYKWQYNPRHAQPGDHKFAKQLIGEKEYRRVMVTISKSVSRLKKRGLVTCYCGQVSHWAGLALTEKGKDLLVNSRLNSAMN